VPMISYSQNREDVLLARVFNDVPFGFYVDVGACDPNHASMTKHFYEHNWTGINIEPGAVFEKLPPARPRDINLNVAASDVRGTLKFTEFPAGPALGSVNPTITEPMRAYTAGSYQRTVPARPLREILAEHADGKTIDFMSIDVEGHERNVILGNDWTRFRPRVLVVEATEPMDRAPTHQRWESLLLQADYLFAYFDGLNRFYVRKEDTALLERFAAPANVFDDFTPWEVVVLEKRLKELDARLNAALVGGDREKKDVARLTEEAILTERRLADALSKLAEARSIINKYRALCQGTRGWALAIALWFARRGTTVCNLFRFGREKHPWPI